MCFDSNKAV